uniref:Transcriptional regulator n=1 Tax=Glossina morsitans morsitans TaxID=37546 RepID=A0A1B0FPW2_GLOMM
MVLQRLAKVLLVSKDYCYNKSVIRRIVLTKYPLLAGHSKWANIKHIKAEKDGEKAMVFLRIARQLRLAIQEGGSTDPVHNSKLRNVIDDALRKNMPMSSIQSSIKKSQQNKTELKRYRLDLRFKQKVFIVLIIYTDNYSGLKQEIASILRKFGAMMIDTNNLFEEYGLIEATVSKERLDSTKNIEELATDDAIECGAEEVEVSDATKGLVNVRRLKAKSLNTENTEFNILPEEVLSLRKSIETKNYIIENTEHIFTPVKYVELSSEEQAVYEKFIAKLHQISGIEEIYDNLLDTTHFRLARALLELGRPQEADESRFPNYANNHGLLMLNKDIKENRKTTQSQQQASEAYNRLELSDHEYYWRSKAITLYVL